MRSIDLSRTARFAGAVMAVAAVMVLGTSATAGAGEDHGEKNTWGEVCPTTTVPPTTVPPTTAPPTTETPTTVIGSTTVAPTTTVPGTSTTTPPTSVLGSTTVVGSTTTAPAGPTTTERAEVLAATTTVLPPAHQGPAVAGRSLAFTGQSLVSTLGIALTFLVIGASLLGAMRRGRAADA